MTRTAGKLKWEARTPAVIRTERAPRLSTGNAAISCVLWLALTGTAFGAGLTLRGKVLEQPSGQGISGATVQLLTTPARDIVGELLTRQGGSFEFSGIEPGRYVVEASKSGYTDAMPWNASQRGVNVTDSSPEVDLTITLVKAAVMSGHVTDSHGRPVRSAMVCPVLRRGGVTAPRYVPGEPRALVDDLGYFRLYGLKPGSYIIAAFPAPHANGPVFLPLFFPGVIDPEKARAIALCAGEQFSQADFFIQASGSHAVAGRVIGLSPSSAGGATVSLFPIGSYGQPLATAATRDDGHFSFADVPYGPYELVAASPVIGAGPFGALLGASPRFGRLQVEVAAQDAELDISLREPGSIEGRAVFASPAEADARCYPSAYASLEPLDPLSSREPLTARLDGHGQLKFPMVPPARYRISLANLGGDCFLKEVRAGGVLAPGDVLTVDGAVQVTLVLSSQMAAIGGTVRRAGVPVGRAAVIAVPSAAQDPVPSEDLAFARTDADGGFRLPSLVPGRYRVIAFQEWNACGSDMAFSAEQRKRSVEVLLAPGSSANADLEIGPAAGE